MGVKETEAEEQQVQKFISIQEDSGLTIQLKQYIGKKYS